MQTKPWSLLIVAMSTLHALGRCVFFDQLYLRIRADSPYPHDAQTAFCLWYAFRPQRRQRMCVVFCRRPMDGVPLDMPSPEQAVHRPPLYEINGKVSVRDFHSSSKEMLLGGELRREASRVPPTMITATTIATAVVPNRMMLDKA